jgi:hypothetical protein
MTYYQVPVSDALLLKPAYWAPVAGLRMVSVDGAWPAHPDVTLCTFEDDGAPPELAGKLVEPVIRTDAEGENAQVVGRMVIGGIP